MTIPRMSRSSLRGSTSYRETAIISRYIAQDATSRRMHDREATSLGPLSVAVRRTTRRPPALRAEILSPHRGTSRRHAHRQRRAGTSRHSLAMPSRRSSTNGCFCPSAAPDLRPITRDVHLISHCAAARGTATAGAEFRSSSPDLIHRAAFRWLVRPPSRSRRVTHVLAGDPVPPLPDQWLRRT